MSSHSILAHLDLCEVTLGICFLSDKHVVLDMARQQTRLGLSTSVDVGLDFILFSENTSNVISVPIYYYSLDIFSRQHLSG